MKLYLTQWECDFKKSEIFNGFDAFCEVIEVVSSLKFLNANEHVEILKEDLSSREELVLVILQESD